MRTIYFIFFAFFFIFSLSSSLQVEKIIGKTNYKIVVEYKERVIINSSSPFTISGRFFVYDENGNRVYVNDANLHVEYPASFGVLSKNVTNETFAVNAESLNSPIGFYLFNFTLKINYTYDNSSEIGIIDFNSSVEVNCLVIDIKVFPTEYCTPLIRDVMCANITNYVVVRAKLFPSNISANTSTKGIYACEDLESNESLIIYIPKKSGECGILVDASKEVDSYFFNFSSKFISIVPFTPEVSFNLTFQNTTFSIFPSENVTFTYSISVKIPQNFTVKIENISLENVEYEKNFEAEKNTTKNITFFNLREGKYVVSIKILSNYSIERNVTIEIYVEKFVNISYYFEEFYKILEEIRKKGLENDSEITKNIEILNQTIQNISIFKKPEDMEKFEKIKEEIKNLILQKESKNITEKKISEMKKINFLQIFIIAGTILATTLFFLLLFRKRKSYFDYKRKKFILSKEEMEIWRKIKERWKKK